MNKEIICGIYKITSPSGKIYIGESKNIYARWKNYKNLSANKQEKIQNSINKYGWEAHKFEILEECDFEDLKCRERYWQDFYGAIGENGLNIKLTECGEKRRTYTQDHSRKMQLNNWANKVVILRETGEEFISLAEACRLLQLDYKLESGRVSNKHNTALFFFKGEDFEIKYPEPVIRFEDGKEFESLRTACKEMKLELRKEYSKIDAKLSTSKFYFKNKPFEKRKSLIKIVIHFETNEEFPSLRIGCQIKGEDYKIQRYSIPRRYSNSKFYFKNEKFERLKPKEDTTVIHFTTGEHFPSLIKGCEVKELDYNKQKDYLNSKSERAQFYRKDKKFEKKRSSLIMVKSKSTLKEYNCLADGCKAENIDSKTERKLQKKCPEKSHFEIIKPYL